MSQSHDQSQPQKLSPTIFVVDDSREIVTLAEMMLRQAGFRVRGFEDPALVLPALAETGAKPELLITDYDMGAHNGLDLAAACRKIHSALLVMVISGTVNDSIIAEHGVPVDKVLRKPYLMAEFIAAVEEVLGRRG